MKKLFCLFLLLLSGAAHAAVQSKVVNYQYQGVTMKGYLAWDDSFSGKRPGILVVHEWWGLNDYARRRAEQLAKIGYVAFASDMYGEGKSTEHPEEAKAMVQEVMKNLPFMLGRAEAALKVLRGNENVDSSRIAAIGYCFGGAVVLNLAYSGADLAAVASFHGALPVPQSTQNIKARILILQGAEDPFVSQETIQQLQAALNAGNVKYKFVSYPGAVHGFTVPGSEKRGMKGVAYNAEADQKSWQEMQLLFQEALGLKLRRSPTGGGL
ncbi:MAG TPA: dienelactone hydrolase family protein [Deltaproteobacteria bacterium]|nr:dienelactone hydrolase family protein [Deltaproteobacteria bacterium]